MSIKFDDALRLARKSLAEGGGRHGKVYHGLPWDNLDANRSGLLDRVGMMKGAYSFSGKKGVDLGCSIGGISFALQLEGAKMLGIDHDTEAINFAKVVESEKHTGAKFLKAKITTKLLRSLENFDFIVWFANLMWIRKQSGEKIANAVFEHASNSASTMFFEYDQGDGKARKFGMTTDGIESLLYRNFDEVRSLGKAAGRPRDMFFAQKHECVIHMANGMATKMYSSRAQWLKEVAAPFKFRPFIYSTNQETLMIREARHRTLCDVAAGLRPHERLALAVKLFKLIKLLSVQMLHRDVHSKNVLVKDDGSLCLIDWNLSNNKLNVKCPDYDFVGSDDIRYLPAVHLKRGGYRHRKKKNYRLGMFWDSCWPFSIKNVLNVSSREAANACK